MPSVPPPKASRPSPPSDPGPSESPLLTRGEVPPWPLWTAAAAIGLGFSLGIVASIFVDVVARAGGSSISHPTPAVSLISDVLFDAAFVGATVWVVRWRGRFRAADFGFRRVRVRLAVGSVVVAAISYYVLSALYASALHFHGNEKLPSELGVSKSAAALVGAALFVCVVAPVAEEFFFRGFIFGVLRRIRVRVAGRDLGTWVAAVITGILFGLSHTGSASSRYLIPLGFLGFVLCLVRWRTGSLYPCIVLHSLNNSLALGIGQEQWNVGEVAGLVAAGVAAVLVLTLPLSGRPGRPSAVT